MADVITRSKDVTLCELLDRILNKGVVITGEVVISVADIDLIYLGLKAILTSVETMERLRGETLYSPYQEPT
jgi:hypothetical protein